MTRLSHKNRQVLLIGLVAAAGAIFSEHLLKPSLKKKLKVK